MQFQAARMKAFSLHPESHPQLSTQDPGFHHHKLLWETPLSKDSRRLQHISDRSSSSLGFGSTCLSLLSDQSPLLGSSNSSLSAKFLHQLSQITWIIFFCS